MTCGPEEQKQGSGALENTPVGQKQKDRLIKSWFILLMFT